MTIRTATFQENETDITYSASESDNGTIIVSFSNELNTRRRKRETKSEIQPLIPDTLPVGCTSIFNAGLFQSDFALAADFFKLNPALKEFGIEVNVTRCLPVDRKMTCSSGVSTLNIKVNDPPFSGNCKIKNIGQTGEDDFTNPGSNTGLLDIFHITCRSWKDPNQHMINKYVFKIVKVTPKGNETSVLGAGPLDNIKAVFGVGIFHLYAEVWDEAGAFTTHDIDQAFTTFLPTQDQYESYDINADVKAFKDVGDAARIAMILQADSSVRQLASWFSLTDLAGDKLREDMSDVEGDNYDSLMINLTNANTQLLNDAADNLQFNTIEELDQGAGALYSITSQLVKGGDLAKTLDMKGREAAVTLVGKMNDGFQKMTVSDPSALKTFIEGTTGSILAILISLNSVLYSNDPDQIPLTDIEAAASLPYDTDIPEDNADIPLDPEVAFKDNAMKVTRINAVSQIKSMVDLVDSIAATALESMVAGEVLDTKAPLGVSMKMAKVSGSNIIGHDIDGDGRPDIPLVYTFEDRSEVEFPLNFCPGVRFDWTEGEGASKKRKSQWHVTPDAVLYPCQGYWGVSMKEWETIKQTYPASARYLNRLTMTVDVDIYDENSDIIDIKKLPEGSPINIKIMRMKDKDKILGVLNMTSPVVVDIGERVDLIKRRNRAPIIYHQVTANKSFSTINVQLRAFNPHNKLAIMAKFEKMMKVDDCDFIQVVNDLPRADVDWVDWFIGLEKVNNRTGDWYFGIVALTNPPLSATRDGVCDDLTKDNLNSDFNQTAEFPGYEIRIYTGGCYYFNTTTEEWEGLGIKVKEGGDTIFSYCSSDHLTSFGTGFFPEPNKIDFEFLLADFDYADNVTIMMVLLVTIILFLITLIWAQLKDRKDVIDQKPHWMKDNLSEDHYFYEIIVQTGPMLSHGTESKVQFIVTGEDNESQVRTLSDPTKKFFKKGSLDTFLMSVDKPLGHLQYIRIWHDNSGIREMQPWYLSYLIFQDLQTGEKFRFLADRWLAIDRADFSSETQVAVSPADGEANKEFLVRQGLFNKLKDDHVFWSVFSRPKRSRFTRTQRTCVSMATLYLAMLTNAMWYGQVDGYIGDPFFEFNGILTFSKEEISAGVISSLIVLVPVIILICLFRKAVPSKKNRSRFDKVIEEAAQEGRVDLPAKSFKREESKERIQGLPGYCYFIAWILTILFITGGMGLVGAYGISFGNLKTYQWITAMFVNFFWNIFIESVIKVGILAIFIGLIKRRPAWDQDHVDADEEIPTIYFDPDNPAVDKRNKANASAPEFDPEYLEPVRFRRMQEGEMNTVIQDICVYLIYVVIVLIVSFGNRDINSFYMKDNLQTTLVHGGLKCGRLEGTPCNKMKDLPKWKNPLTNNIEGNPYVDFMQVREVNQWWLWVTTSLIPNVRVQNWYNGDPPYGLRGYLDDRVNRIIGYALVRQVREKVGNCHSPMLMRDYVDSCTGDLKIPIYDEDDKTYCMGWLPLVYANCTRMEEFNYKTENDREAMPFKADYNTYSGGGYELKLKGHIDKLKERLEILQKSNWIDNRTRALIVEFSVYNAQVNLFGVIKIVAEFVGGGVNPYNRIEVIRLTRVMDFKGYVVTLCEFLFCVATFYYVLSSIISLKTLGCSEFFKDSWNIVDIFTTVFSVLVMALYAVKIFVVMDLTKGIKRTRGNEYIPIENAQKISQQFDYCVSITVFTSLIKFCRLLSFQKAFRQIAATLKLCFIGLGTFVIEFVIIFGSFCCFFYFVLNADLRNFFDPIHTIQNTIAMAIGKFNFASLRAANEMAAWIFFAFSICVNMILINMMMAIINLAFEEIKNKKDSYQNKFEIIEYIKRTTREMTGTRPAERDVPKYKEVIKKGESHIRTDKKYEMDAKESTISTEFSQKTEQLLDLIEKNYLTGKWSLDRRGKQIINKMKLAENSNKARAMDYGFDNIFVDGPTPTPSAVALPNGKRPEMTSEEVAELETLSADDADGNNV